MTKSLRCTILALLFIIQTPFCGAKAPKPFNVVESNIQEMQTAMQQGRITSREIVQQYLIRIAIYNGKLNAIIGINPHALEEADAVDRERAAGKIRGPLHGIPIALKDNIHTTNMPTTGGALAFNSLIPPYEATLTKNLLDAGAIIIAKTNMTELANWVSNDMPGNYNGLVGYGFNPYDPRRDPRKGFYDGRPVLATGGSSSGVGTSANFWAANVGTETSGSILSPSNQNMLVAIKPTLGRISRYGVIPITADQDTPGPMARSVGDAALVLGVLEDSKQDPKDPASSKCSRVAKGDYSKFLKTQGLKGARIGIPRAFFYNKITPPGGKKPQGGLNDAQSRIMKEAIAVLKRQGAIIVDPVVIPSIVSTNPKENFLLWTICDSLVQAKEKESSCSIVFKYGMKRDFNKWLDSLGPTAPLKSLEALRKWNLAHQKAGSMKYGQGLLDISDDINLEADAAKYRADREKDFRLSATNGIDAAMKKHHLDALLFPGASSGEIAAKAGYPTVIVPFGFVPNSLPPSETPFPKDFAAKPMPFGVSFTGMACSEPILIKLAYGFEQATKRRIPPPNLTLDEKINKA
ncbi:MAG: amidase [Tatlockia sp.]|nr:amidase [Tatlockia sp.]